MVVEHIPLEITGQFSRFVRDYLAKKQDMQDFSDFAPDMDGVRARAEHLDGLGKDNALLAKVLREQHGTHLSPSQSEHLHALQADAAYTVCTGHQLALFAGPSYVIYKAISIIALSRQLSEELGRKVVPVFWLASEDHDVAEVDHCQLFGKEIRLEHDYSGPVGPMALTQIEGTLAQLEEVLGGSDVATQLMELMRASYSSSGTMATAFRALLQQILGDQGLLILDADHAELKASFAGHMSREIGANGIKASVDEMNAMILNRGEKPQAHVRDINLFYMSDGRSRIQRSGDGFETVDGTRQWTSEEIRQELSAQPQRFSPNVLMRPLYQEHLLPNLVTIGGPGELAYWLQLRKAFEHQGMKMPVVLLRDSFAWTNDKFSSKLEALGLSFRDLFQSEDQLHRDFAKRSGEIDLDMIKEKEAMLAQFDRLIQRSQSIDPGVAKFAEAERKRLAKSIDSLEQKWVRAEKKKNETALNRISRLRSDVLPQGKLAERVENFMSWYLQMGGASIDVLLQAADPLQATLKLISSSDRPSR